MNKYKLIDKIFQKQEELNNKTLPDWKLKLDVNNWEEAILVETAEALDSSGYKWWKKQEIDIENIKVELIDILHFLSSLSFYYSKQKDEIIDSFIQGNLNNMEKLDINRNINEFRKILLLIGKNKNIVDSFRFLGIAFSWLDISIEKIYILYMTKNFLNEFRQKNGYKNGTYIKYWRYNNNIVEDNVVAFDISSNINELENFEEIFMNKLDKYYKTHILHKKEKNGDVNIKQNNTKGDNIVIL